MSVVVTRPFNEYNPSNAQPQRNVMAPPTNRLPAFAQPIHDNKDLNAHKYCGGGTLRRPSSSDPPQQGSKPQE